MPATAPWLASIEALLNRNVAASSRATSLLRRLEGTRVALQVQPVTRLHIAACAGHLMLLADDGTSADASIVGSPLALLALMRGGAAAPRESGVEVSGNAEIANLYRELLQAAQPDLEEELARVLGDLPARQVARVARHAVAWLKSTRRTARENIAEYLTEESRDVVSRTEAEEFLQGVDELREAADRAEARLKVLERHRPVAG